MDKLISRQAAMSIPLMPKEHRTYQTSNLDDAYNEGWGDYQACISQIPPAQQWIPVTERLPIKEFEEGRKNKTVYDIYPCLVTRYSTHTEEARTRTYVCKSYFDGEDFMLHGGYAPNEESDTENTLAWMPMMEPYIPTQSNDSNALDALGEETQHGKKEAMG